MIKRLYHCLKWHLSGMKLMQKIFLSYLLFIIVPLGIFSYLTFEKFSEILENRIIFSTQKNFDQTFSYISVTFNKIAQISDIAVSNEDVQKVFEGRNSSESRMDDSFFIGRVMKALDSMKDEENICNIELYLPEGNPYTELGYFFPDMKEARNKKWYNALNLSASKLFWCPPSYLNSADFFPDQIQQGRILSAIRKVKDPNNLSENIGLLRVDFRESTVRNILEMTTAVKGSFTYIQNAEGILVTDSGLQPDSGSHLPVAKALIDRASDREFTLDVVDGEKIFYMVRQFEQTDWYLTTIISYNEIFSETRNMRNEIFILILAIATAAFAVARYIAYSMTKRISLLTRKMHQVQNGKLDSITETCDRDEIGELTRNYNFMLERILQLIEERYQAGLEAKNMELKALQAQINPHFLYNTLDMINWLAQKNKASDVEQAVNSLAMFYKLSLNNGQDEVPIKDELEHIFFYVQLQNMRFQNKLHLVVEVDEEIQEYPILKLILQPIIENAILHGIMKKSSREGTIIIEGKMENGTIVLYVQDDGIGMTEEGMENLMQLRLESRHNGGYGVKNIIERIKLFYGKLYGLNYKSIYGQGTNVEIRIPAKENDHGRSSIR